MARFRGYPKDYAPALRCWLREQPEGGALPAAGVLEGDAQAQSRRECLVLIHGYNNHAGEAATAYIGFRRRQCGWFDDLPAAKLEQLLADVHWPGDCEWAGPLDWLDFLVYPYAVGVAVKAAERLADLLQRLASLERVHFIGHSLGCRVVLETVALLRRRGYPAIGRVCLMAAAVPCEMVEPGGKFDALLQALEADNVPVRVLHSTNDRVLRFAFPPGQTGAGEPTLRALGLHGPPPDMPGRGANVTDLRIDGAAHGDYWGHAVNMSAEAASRDAGIFMQLGERPRPFAARPVGAARDLGTARTAGRPRDAGGD